MQEPSIIEIDAWLEEWGSKNNPIDYGGLDGYTKRKYWDLAWEFYRRGVEEGKSLDRSRE